MGPSCRPSYMRVWHACLLVNAILLCALLLPRVVGPGRLSERFQTRIVNSVGAGIDLLNTCYRLSCAQGSGLCGLLVESALLRNETAGTSCSTFLRAHDVACADAEPGLSDCDGFYREVVHTMESAAHDAGGYVVMSFVAVSFFLLLCAMSFEEYTRASARPEMRDAATWVVVGWLAAVRAASARVQPKPSPALPSDVAVPGTLVSIETR